MLIDRDALLARRCSLPWRVVYGAGCVAAMMAATCLPVGTRPAYAQAEPNPPVQTEPSQHPIWVKEGETQTAPAGGEQATQGPAHDQEGDAAMHQGEESRELRRRDPQALRSRIAREMATRARDRSDEAMRRAMAALEEQLTAMRKRLEALRVESDNPEEQARMDRESERVRDALKKAQSQAREAMELAQEQIAQAMKQAEEQVRRAREQVREETERARREFARERAERHRQVRPPSDAVPTPDRPRRPELPQVPDRPRPEGGAELPLGTALRLPGRSSLDLVNLANSYVDAVGDLKAARVQYERIQKMRDQNVASSEEKQMARIKVETAETKVALLRAIIEAALSVARSEMETLRIQVNTGRAPATALTDVENRVRILELILKSSSDETR